MKAVCVLLHALLLLLVTSDRGEASPTPSKRKVGTYFAMCLLVKNDPHLREWIEYHRRMGCTKFYVFDHNSTKPVHLQHPIQRYINKGLVEVTQMTKEYKPNAQMYAYNQCIQHQRPYHQFMAFIDTDEYIVVRDNTLSIPEVLRRYEQYGGLLLFWKLFGSSGYVKRPRGGVLANYNRCVNNYQVKTIANLQHTLSTSGNPHSMTYMDGYFSVDTAGQPCAGPMPDATVCNRTGNDPVPAHLFDIMYINHYFTKSEQEWGSKLRKGTISGAKYNMALFNRVRNETESQPNCSYLKMPETVRKRLKFKISKRSRNKKLQLMSP